MKCLQCDKEIEIVNSHSKYKKFCNRRCSGTYNSSRRKINPEWFESLRGKKSSTPIKKCKNCKSDMDYSISSRYCSDLCKQQGTLISREYLRKKAIIPEYPFDTENFICYISELKNKRKVIAFYDKNGANYSFGMSYARYLMCIHLNRILEKEEQVDHINNDPSDDRIENLQILSAQDNINKFVKEVLKGEKILEVKCICGAIFSRKKRLCKGKKFLYCTKECGYKYCNARDKKETEILREYRKYD